MSLLKSLMLATAFIGLIGSASALNREDMIELVSNDIAYTVRGDIDPNAVLVLSELKTSCITQIMSQSVAESTNPTLSELVSIQVSVRSCFATFVDQINDGMTDKQAGMLAGVTVATTD